MPCIGDALQMLVWERVTEVLPALRTLFLDEPGPSRPLLEIIAHFIFARQLVGHSNAVSRLRVRSIYSNVNRANSFVTVGHNRPCGQLGLKIRSGSWNPEQTTTSVSHRQASISIQRRNTLCDGKQRGPY